MPTVNLRKVPEPAAGTRTVFTDTKTPIMKGDGDQNYLCGGCRTVLIHGLQGNVVMTNVVYKCPSCGAFNEMP